MPRIGSYAVIGDCRSAALVSRNGSLDWLCWPQFSSPAVFGALLDEARGGRFRIRPTTPFRATRRYLADTNVLETTWTTRDGVARVIDAMPLPAGTDLQPMREVLRLVEGVSGAVRLRFEIDPRPGYGLQASRLESRGTKAWAWLWGNEWLQLESDVALQPQGTRLEGEFAVAAGERRWSSLAYSHAVAGVTGNLGAAQERLDDTVRWWRAWSARARYQGPHREAVVRSALTLKLLVHALSGAVVAAPTTSLPEAIGADRNWDYRYCWLRDAALTMRAFTSLGYLAEARAFLDWMLHATRLTWPRLQVLYDVYGGTHLRETELTHWQGFGGSRPVRIGNKAAAQLQLDVYGAVCFAAREIITATGELAPDEARLLRGFGQSACELWQQPDHGIWEIRGQLRHYTFSKVMCWTALDALIELGERGLVKVPTEFARARDALRDLIETRGYNGKIGSYVAVLDDTTIDASLLLMGCLGYSDPDGPRMRSTFSAIHERLARNGLLLRYEHGLDGMAAREGAFGICSFWAIDNLACRGDRRDAQRSFEHVLGFANDVGLLSEEIDPASGALLGNFPQAYTHVGVINAALALAAA